MYLIGENKPVKIPTMLNTWPLQIQTDDSRMKPVKIEKRAHIERRGIDLDALAVKMKYHKGNRQTITECSIREGAPLSFFASKNRFRK